MGLLGDPVEKAMEKYGLNGISEPDKDSVRAIVEHLSGSGLMDFGMKLSFSAKTEDRLQIAYLQSIFEQNWIMIRQLDRIAKALEKE